MYKRHKFGFTIIEILASVAILATLVVFSLMYVANYVTFGQQTAQAHQLEALNRAVEEYRMLGGITKSHSLGGDNTTAKITAVINALRTGFTSDDGCLHNFLPNMANLDVTRLAATGTGNKFVFTTPVPSVPPTYVTGLAADHSPSVGANTLFSGFTVSGTNRLLIVAIAQHPYGDTTNNVCFNGQPLTMLAETYQWDNATGRLRVWYMVNPPAVTADITADFTNWGNCGKMVLLFNGVNQTTPLGPVSSQYYLVGTTHPDPLTMDVTSAANDLCIQITACWSASFSTSGGQTLMVQTNSGLPMASSYKVATGSTTTMSQGLGAPIDFGCAQHCVAIKP